MTSPREAGVVDREHFDVTRRVGEPGVYELRRTSGPNAEYGLATSTYGCEGQADDDLEDAVFQNFLSQVDPTIGYFDEVNRCAAERDRSKGSQ